MSKNQKALHDVLQERVKQDEKWGEQNHDMVTWVAILMEEVGELSAESLTQKFTGRTTDNLREEAVQTAAVALAIVECIDRNNKS